jgi:hypothetical protein
LRNAAYAAQIARDPHGSDLGLLFNDIRTFADRAKAFNNDYCKFF